jgi:hypothetical protein
MISQIAVAITGIMAVWLSQDPRISRRKYACWFGLLGQPFWFYISYSEQQWGIFLLSFVYTAGWYRGFKMYWLDKKLNDGETIGSTRE